MICAHSARLGGCHFQIVLRAAVVQQRIEATKASWNEMEARGLRGLRRTTVGRGEPVKGPLQWRCSWSICCDGCDGWEKGIQREPRRWKWGGRFGEALAN